jgi:hypothetical protein
MASTYVQIHRFGTQAQYDALEAKNPNFLYFTSDTGKLYKGNIDYTNNLIAVATVPATGVAGKVYFESTTGMVKAYVGGEWKVISYPVTQDIDSANASQNKLASEKAIVDYVEEMIGGEGVVADIAQKLDAEDAPVPGTLEVTKGDGTTYDVALSGVANNPTWNPETRVLTIPVVGRTAVTANIGKDIFLDPTPGKNYFDSETKEIVLTLNNDPENPTVIRIPASALYNDYTGASTNSGTVAIDATSHSISFDLNINSSTANALRLDANGLMVDLGAYATTESVEAIRSNLQGQIDTTTASLAATTASLDTLTNNYNATTAALDTLTSNYNGTTAALDTLTANYNATTAALDTLTSNYNATTVTVAENSANITALAEAATTWGAFA